MGAWYLKRREGKEPEFRFLHKRKKSFPTGIYHSRNLLLTRPTNRLLLATNFGQPVFLILGSFFQSTVYMLIRKRSVFLPLQTHPSILAGLLHYVRSIISQKTLAFSFSCVLIPPALWTCEPLPSGFLQEHLLA